MISLNNFKALDFYQSAWNTGTPESKCISNIYEAKVTSFSWGICFYLLQVSIPRSVWVTSNTFLSSLWILTSHTSNCVFLQQSPLCNVLMRETVSYVGISRYPRMCLLVQKNDRCGSNIAVLHAKLWEISTVINALEVHGIDNHLVFSHFTHHLWCRIYASVSWVSIDSGNGLSPFAHQTITWSNAVLLSIVTLETNLGKILIKIHNFSFININLKYRLWNGSRFVQGGDEFIKDIRAIINSWRSRFCHPKY